MVGTVQQRVQRGINLLDADRPGWWIDVDTDILDIDDLYRCVLGQVYGNFTTGLVALSLAGGYGEGFNRSSLQPVGALNQEWVKRIKARRAESERMFAEEIERLFAEIAKVPA